MGKWRFPREYTGFIPGKGGGVKVDYKNKIYLSLSNACKEIDNIHCPRPTSPRITPPLAVSQSNISIT